MKRFQTQRLGAWNVWTGMKDFARCLSANRKGLAANRAILSLAVTFLPFL